MGLTFLPPHPTTASLPTYRLITTTSSSPFIFPLFLVGIAAADVAAGSYHTCALLRFGGAACWGSNQYGQLGTGDTAQRTLPTLVLGLTGFGGAVGEEGMRVLGSAAVGAQCCARHFLFVPRLCNLLSSL